MKKILTVLLVMVMVLPTFVFAKSNKYIEKYKTMNFKETLKDESITLENKTYKENDKQITIYLFRGKGCPHCEDFLNFLNSISPEYGKYFKLVSFEVWYDKTNSELMSNVGKFLDKDIAGVPFIIIGDKTYAGYAETYDEDIKKAIKDLYNTDKKKRYDVFKEMDKAENGGSNKTLIWTFTFDLLFAGAVIGFVAYSNNKTKKELIAKQDEILSLVKKSKK